ncbi:dipeptidyl-peptidase 4-related [Anaeramoeba ignava]|uniref:Dipeptidyl-peptidase 4-related n=1 Tax=Anaeramoeba ignava TaxID=1746090 RepID=A0A9Q0R462_ANAIG|nr:dipeptidyl-peptidase 4-related [Anaeramoeba ignava]
MTNQLKDKIQQISYLLSQSNHQKIPRNLHFYEDKLLFIGEDYKISRTTNLYTADIKTGEWKAIYEGNLTESKKTLSKEEILLQERQRKRNFSGLSNYIINEKNQILLFPLSGNTIYYDSLIETSKNSFTNKDINKSLIEITPKDSISSSPRMSPSFSSDSRFLSFVRDNDLFITLIDNKNQNTNLFMEFQLTQGSKSAYAEFVMQEEFDRFDGYWWSPSVYLNDSIRTYRILYLEVDESEITKYPILNQAKNSFEVDNFLFPFVGTKNAKCDLRLIEINENIETGEIKWEKYKLKTPIFEEFSWAEYIVRCGWVTDGQHYWVQLLDRSQEKLSLIRFGLDSFISEKNGDQESTKIKYDILIEEKTEIWINVTDICYFFEKNPNQFIWASEKSGFRHLYLKVIVEDEKRNVLEVKTFDITKGENWQVCELVSIDEINQLVYFMGTKDTPLEKHLYVASLKQGNDPTQIHRLTEFGFNNIEVAMNSKCTMFVSKKSSIQKEATITIYGIEFPEGEKYQPPNIKTLANVDTAPSIVYNNIFPICKPEIFNFQSKTGEDLYGCFYRPNEDDFQPPYKTFLNIYGGPHVQQVKNDYSLTSNLLYQTLVSMGYAVVIIDGRGSWNRGLHFESYFKKKMGTFELEDQIQGLKTLSDFGIVDLSRIAVYGWSYGGYMVAMAMARYSNFFKLGICCAPVISWNFYDTGYTERYMDTPQKNQQAYEKETSVLSYVKDFPDETNRFLLVHGLLDENVHFTHSYSLIEALIENGKPYILQLFPRERHGVRNWKSYIHLQGTILSFLEQNL